MSGMDGPRLSELYDVHAREILRFLARRTSDPETAVDILAETFAVAFERRREFRGTDDQSERAWLFTIARHQLVDHFRSELARDRAVGRLGIERRGLTDAEYERIEELAGTRTMRDLAAERLQELPVEQQEAVRLRVVCELPYEEVAKQLGITRQAARARVSRGLLTLRAAIADPPHRMPERTC
jgi:RNA polymerase sigma-70 factor (ECF subfamily)